VITVGKEERTKDKERNRSKNIRSLWEKDGFMAINSSFCEKTFFLERKYGYIDVGLFFLMIYYNFYVIIYIILYYMKRLIPMHVHAPLWAHPARLLGGPTGGQKIDVVQKVDDTKIRRILLY
jgi:hypothetical protein